MRHLKAGRRLNRNASHRLALFRNLALALFRKERVITTVAKAKAVRPFIEKLITLARKNTLHARRLVLARLGTPSKAEVKPESDDPQNPEKADTRHVIAKLFNEIAPRFADRPGGYLRILKRHQRRLGDAGETAFLELVKAGERKPRKQKAPAPAPVVAPRPAPAPAPAPAPQPPPEASSTPPADQQQNPPAGA
jgi:large subunit ribosomal protein L17